MDTIKWIASLTIVLLLFVLDNIVNMDNSALLVVLDLRPFISLFIVNIHFLVCERPMRINIFALITLVISIISMIREKWFIVCGLILVSCLPIGYFFVKWSLESVHDQYVSVSKVSFRMYEYGSFESDIDVIAKDVFTFQRYPGEDVEFICYTSYKYPCIWLFNGTLLNLTWRLHHHTRKVYRKNVFGREDYIRIYLITPEDFGTYSCAVQLPNKTAYRFHHRNQYLLPLKPYIFHSVLCEFTLEEVRPEMITLKIPIGGIHKSYSNFYTLNDDEDILNKKMVNGQSLELTCDDHNNKCSPLLHYYEWFFLGHHTEDIFMFHKGNLEVTYLYATFSSMCICPKAFGNHSTSFFRNIYNGSSHRYELVEIPHPYTYFITPAKSPLFKWRLASAPEDSGSSIGNYEPNVITETLLEENIFYRDMVEYVIIWGFISLCVIYTVFLIGFVTKCGVRLYRDVCFVNNLMKRQFQMKGRKLNICIVCCEEDMRWSVEILDPIFKAEGHKTFIHYRDTHPGQTELGGIRQIMNTCKIHVIVVSETSILCPLWIHHTDTVLGLLMRREMPDNNILVVNVDDAVYEGVEHMMISRDLACLSWSREQTDDDYFANKMEIIFWILMTDENLYLKQN